MCSIKIYYFHTKVRHKNDRTEHDTAQKLNDRTEHDTQHKNYQCLSLHFALFAYNIKTKTHTNGRDL